MWAVFWERVYGREERERETGEKSGKMVAFIVRMILKVPAKLAISRECELFWQTKTRHRQSWPGSILSVYDPGDSCEPVSVCYFFHNVVGATWALWMFLWEFKVTAPTLNAVSFWSGCGALIKCTVQWSSYLIKRRRLAECLSAGRALRTLLNCLCSPNDLSP